MSIAKNRKDKCVHTEHCCAIHGCKYGHYDCPVETMKKAQSYPCEQCDEDSGNEGYSIYIDRITDLERRNGELEKALDWVLADYEGMCRHEYPPSANWKKRVVVARAALKFQPITRTKEQNHGNAS